MALRSWCVLLLVAASSAAADHPPRIGPAKADDNGFLSHVVESDLQAGPTEIKVLLPDRIEKDKRYPVVYVLPVEAGLGKQFGYGLLEVKKLDLHNKHGVICVLPTFAHLPWYADHPSNAKIRQESYFVNEVVPFIDRQYPTTGTADGRLLLGFSKSGCGAFTLLLRHPKVFGKAAVFDAPLTMAKPNNFGMADIYATQENFEKYRIPKLLEERAKDLGKDKRLALIGYANFGEHHRTLHEAMDRLKIAHEYQDDKKARHTWDAGWIGAAVQFLTTK